ncbi:hypothetical protein THAOC_24389, partial [Thalassiosira oceanica]
MAESTPTAGPAVPSSIAEPTPAAGPTAPSPTVETTPEFGPTVSPSIAEPTPVAQSAPAASSSVVDPMPVTESAAEAPSSLAEPTPSPTEPAVRPEDVATTPVEGSACVPEVCYLGLLSELSNACLLRFFAELCTSHSADPLWLWLPSSSYGTTDLSVMRRAFSRPHGNSTVYPLNSQVSFPPLTIGSLASYVGEGDQNCSDIKKIWKESVFADAGGMALFLGFRRFGPMSSDLSYAVESGRFDAQRS